MPTESRRIRVRIDEIPVRGLKLRMGWELTPINQKVRIDEIPVRGLKPPFRSPDAGLPEEVRIDEIPVRGLKLILACLTWCPGPPSQNRRNPRQGIETKPWTSGLFIGGRVRIDEIPVRGLKLLVDGVGAHSHQPVRIDEIPVRGLKRMPWGKPDSPPDLSE